MNKVLIILKQLFSSYNKNGIPKRYFCKRLF